MIINIDYSKEISCFDQRAISSAGDANLQPETVSVDSYNTNFQNNPVAFWGKNNLLPQELNESSENCEIVQACIRKLVSFCFGNGIFAYKERIENGKIVIDEVYNKDIKDFFEFTNINEYFIKAATDYYKFGNCFPYIKAYKPNNKTKKVGLLDVFDAAFCRKQKINPNSPNKRILYYTSFWKDLVGNIDTLISQYPNFFKKYEELKKVNYESQFINNPQDVFVININNYTSGRNYYHSVPWHAAFFNGTVDLASGYSETRKAFFKNALKISVLIHIDPEFWKVRYGNSWPSDFKAQEKLVDEYLLMLERSVTGKSDAFKSLYVPMLYNNMTQEHRKLIEFEQLNFLKGFDTTFIPEAQQAYANIIFAFGLDQSLLGTVALNGKSKSGSGSDRREALLVLNNALKQDREMLLRPLYIIKKLNGWDQDIKFGIRTIELTTLDVNPTGSKNVM